MASIVFFSAKSYDQQSFIKVNHAFEYELHFHDFGLTDKTAKKWHMAHGSEVVCAFVNDDLSRNILIQLKEQGVKLIAMRCAGFNKVDLLAAKELGLQVVHVSAYSPEAEAEHAVGLMMTLNRRFHKAYQRTRDANFSLDGLVGFNLHGKTAGIIGTGNIGLATMRILKGFGMKLLCFHPYEKTAALELGATYCIKPS